MASPYEKLIVATAHDVQTTTTTEIRKGPLRSTFLAGPQRDLRPAGPQAPNSGSHYDPKVPMLFQFDDNIMCNIASYLDPIWLFQLELTSMRMARFLRNRNTNFVWYRSLPGAMVALPEFFQKEEVISQRSPNSPFEFDRRFLVNVINTAQASTQLTHVPARGTSNHDLLCLPSLDSVSTNTVPLHLAGTMTGSGYVQGDYLTGLGGSFIIRYGSSPPRMRTLALGGPFQPHFDYRRELLGHLLFTSRCQLCLEVCPAQGQLAPQDMWYAMGGLWVCSHCSRKLSVSYQDVARVEGLCDYLAALTPLHDQYPWSQQRFPALQPATLHWRAMIDDFIRRKCGLDFDTLLAKQTYFEHILDVKRASTRPIFTARRNVRQELMTIAQDQWRRGVVRGVASAKVVAIRNAVRVNRIGDFLFKAHNVSPASLYQPATIGLRWPADPVSALRYTRDCNGRSHRWKVRKAGEMLANVLSNTNNDGERMAQALEQYHIQRLRNALSNSASQLNMIGFASVASVAIFVFALHQTMFLRVHPTLTGGARLTNDGQAAAMAAWGGVAQAAVTCRFCSVGPRGLESVVRHIRECHPQVFYGTMDWFVG